MPVNASLLQYDIPDAVDFPNPSPILRRIGFRSNLSVWVIPNHRIPWTLLNDMQAAGCIWHVVKFDTSEAKHLASMCAIALRQEIVDAVNMARTSESAAMRADLARARRLLADAREACKSFELNPDTFEFGNSHRALMSIGLAAKVRAKLYADAATEIAQLGDTVSQGMAAAIRANEVPVGIVADYMQDNCLDDGKLRRMFAGE
jgi:hypothetical protein